MKTRVADSEAGAGQRSAATNGTRIRPRRFTEGLTTTNRRVAIMNRRTSAPRHPSTPTTTVEPRKVKMTSTGKITALHHIPAIDAAKTLRMPLPTGGHGYTTPHTTTNTMRTQSLRHDSLAQRDASNDSKRHYQLSTLYDARTTLHWQHFPQLLLACSALRLSLSLSLSLSFSLSCVSTRRHPPAGCPLVTLSFRRMNVSLPPHGAALALALAQLDLFLHHVDHRIVVLGQILQGTDVAE